MKAGRAPSTVLMTADTVGGVWTYAMELARSLRPHGIRIVLATMGAPLRADQRAEVAKLEHVRVEESEYALEWMESPWSDVARAGEWLLELEERHEPSLIHLNGYSHAALAWRAPVLVVAHSCVLSWWQSVKGEAAPAAWNAYRENVRTGLQAADAIVAPTRWMAAQLSEHYGDLPRVEVIGNGRRVDGAADRQKEPFVLSVGRLWDEAKNARALAAVAPGLSWPVVLAGDDTGPDGRRAELRNVTLLGRQSPAAVIDLCQRAAIYASPARYEPFGLSLLEAAHCGCALVVSDIPSLREVWGTAAEYVPPDRPEAFGPCIERLIQNPLRQRQLAKAARERARAFTPERMADAYLERYVALSRGRAASLQTLVLPS